MKSPLRNWYDVWYRKLWHRHIPKTDVDKLVQRYEGMVVTWHPDYLGHMINSLRNLMVPWLNPGVSMSPLQDLREIHFWFLVAIHDKHSRRAACYLYSISGILADGFVKRNQLDEDIYKKIITRDTERLSPYVRRWSSRLRRFRLLRGFRCACHIYRTGLGLRYAIAQTTPIVLPFLPKPPNPNMPRGIEIDLANMSADIREILDSLLC